MPRDSKADPVWRKKKSRVSKEPPFPVPVASIRAGLLSRQTWYCYTGFLKGSTVVVQHSGDVDFLYRMGFFGKGSLSRSEPNFDARRRKVNIPNPNKDASSDQDSEGPSGDTIQLAVASKRNYLTHLQFRALAEDDEVKYNELIEQETMQRFRNGEEDEDFEAEDEEEEEEEEGESYESDSSSPIKFASDADYGFEGESGQSGFSLDLQSQSKSFLISLLSQVAELSKENIATFVRVPQTLHQLEIKFQKKRLEQLDYRNAVDHPSDPSASKSISKSRSQDVIDLRDLDESNDVVVLNSDENSKDSERHVGGESEKRAGKTSKSWDDPDNEGDAKFWGMDTPEVSEKAESQESVRQGLTIESSLPSPGPQSISCKTLPSSSSLNSELNVSKGPESLENGATNDGEKIDKKTLDKEMASEKNGNEKNDTGISGDLQTQVSATKKDLKDCPVPDDQNADPSGKTGKNGGQHPQSISGKNASEETGDSVSVDSAKLEEAPSVPGGDPNSPRSQANPKATSSISPPNEEDSNDSDDVICVEAGSAEPSKLHNFLSQSSFQAQTLPPFPLISKMVRFMTNIAKEPRFVTAKVGFHSWTNILHFNFSGDATHLPTAVEVLQEESETNPHSFPSHAVRNIVYERIYPPVGSLLADPDSKGVVIKQRLEGIPFLDVARRNVLSSLSSASHQSHSDNKRVPSSHHKPFLHKRFHQKLSSFSLQNEPAHPGSASSHQIFNLFEKEKEESTSLEPSHLAQYVSVFQRERSHRTLDDIDTNNSRSDTKSDKSDECLERLHREIHELNAFSLVSNQATTEKEEVTDKDTKMLKFNCLVSRYMSKIGISLIKEFVLLKILVCGSESNENISKDFVVAAKAKLSPEEYSSLLERMDFVQSCLASYKSSHSVVNKSEEKESTDDVIMIDLSDEESNDKNEAGPFVASSSTLPPSLPSESQNVSKTKANRDSCKNSGEGNFASGDTEITLEGLSNRTGRKRSRHDSEESEQRSDPKIPKVDLLHSENSKDEIDSSMTLNGSQAVTKSHISSNHQKADDTDSTSLGKHEKNEKADDTDSTSLGKHEKNKKADDTDSTSLGKHEKNKKADDTDSTSLGKHEKNDNSDIQFKDKKHDSNSDTQRDVSVDKRDSSSSEVSGHSISTLNREIPDKGIASVGANDEIKVNSSVCASSDIVDKSASQNVQKSAKDKDNPGTSHVSLEENQIYIESSDEEGERLSIVKAKSLAFAGSRPHPYSIRDDPKGNLFVVPNTSDEEDEEASSSLAERFTWQSCVKTDPYPSSEHLHLLLEEAFFLTFGLGCLSVLDPEKKPMTITEMWQQFPTLKDNFVPHYVAYHYFRSKGWVPKSGLKFGCDFVLYREGPPFFHGSYSVVVVAVEEGTLTPMIGDEGGLDYAQRLNTWITLSGLNRVTEHVAKELMFCYVICPKNLTEEESKSPKCMSRFRVKEIVVSRWVSSKEREAKDKEEMP